MTGLRTGDGQTADKEEEERRDEIKKWDEWKVSRSSLSFPLI